MTYNNRATDGRAPGHDDAVEFARLALMFDQETGSTLRMGLLVIGVAALANVPVHARRDIAGALGLALAAAILGVGCLATWLFTRRHPLPPRYHNPLFAIVILATAFDSVYTQALVRDPMFTINVTMVIIGAGVCIVSCRWALAATLPPTIAWFAFAAPPMSTSDGRSAATIVLFGFCAAAIINTGRRNALTRLAKATRVAERAAVVDDLTQVYNRRGLALVASHVATTARRLGEDVGVLVLDIDCFKAVNDKLGHVAGDRVLVAVAEALTNSGRANDVVARWGGDEFVVVTLGKPPKAAVLARRVEDRLYAHGVRDGDGARITVSVGAASANLIDAEGVDRLIDEADAAMYDGRAQLRTPAGRSLVSVPPQNLSTGR